MDVCIIEGLVLTFIESLRDVVAVSAEAAVCCDDGDVADHATVEEEDTPFAISEDLTETQRGEAFDTVKRRRRQRRVGHYDGVAGVDAGDGGSAPPRRRPSSTNARRHVGLMGLFVQLCKATPLTDAVATSDGGGGMGGVVVAEGGATPSVSSDAAAAAFAERGRSMARLCAAMAGAHHQWGSTPSAASSVPLVAQQQQRFTTVRDLYYSDTSLFESQAKASRAVEVLGDLLTQFVLLTVDKVARSSDDDVCLSVATRLLASSAPIPSSLFAARLSRTAVALVPLLPFTREALGFGATARSLLLGHVGFCSGGGSAGGHTGSPSTGFGVSLSHPTTSLPTGYRATANASAPFIDVAAMGTKGVTISTEMGCAAHRFVFGSSRRSGAHGKGSSSSGGGYHAPRSIDIFVVEKECTLMTVTQREGGLEGQHYASALGGGDCDDGPPSTIFMCGKGYPCVASRELLRRLVEEAVAQAAAATAQQTAGANRPRTCPRVRLFFVVDGDGDGILIMLSYLAALVGVGGGNTGSASGRRRPVATHSEGSAVATAEGSGPPRAILPSPFPPPFEVEWLGLRPTMIGALKEAFSAAMASTCTTTASGDGGGGGGPPIHPSASASALSPHVAALPITVATDRCMSKLKTIERSATAIAARCDAVLAATMAAVGRRGSSPPSLCPTAAAAADATCTSSPAAVIVAAAVRDMLVARLPSEVDFMRRTRLRAELQLAHAVASAHHSAHPAPLPPSHQGTARLSSSSLGYALSTTLGLLLATSEGLSRAAAMSGPLHTQRKGGAGAESWTVQMGSGAKAGVFNG